jgi:hypothetical protein
MSYEQALGDMLYLMWMKLLYTLLAVGDRSISIFLTFIIQSTNFQTSFNLFLFNSLIPGILLATSF